MTELSTLADTSAMTRVALYAGRNCFIHAGKGSTVSSPNGSRNMRKSRKKRPQGKPAHRKPMYTADVGPKVFDRYGSTRNQTTRNCATSRKMETHAHR